MKLTRSSLKELIRQSIKEIDFEDEEAFKKYQSQHKMRPTTKVNIGGKDTTVGDASSGKGGGMGDKEKAAQQSGGGDVSSLQMKLRDLDPDGNITYPEQDEDGTWWYDNYDNDTTRDGFESEEEAYQDAIDSVADTSITGIGDDEGDSPSEEDLSYDVEQAEDEWIDNDFPDTSALQDWHELLSNETEATGGKNNISSQSIKVIEDYIDAYDNAMMGGDEDEAADYMRKLKIFQRDRRGIDVRESFNEGGPGSGPQKGGGALPVGKKKLKHPSGQDQYGKKAKIPNIRKVQITNAAPDVIRPDHISKTLKALEKAGSDKAKNFKKLGDMYIKHKNDLADKYNRVYNDGKGDEKKAEALWYKGMAKQEKIGKELQKLMKESKTRRFTVKEVQRWMKTLEENRYKRVYNSDCRRVSWMANNMNEDVATMPKSMRKKWTKAQYGRERYLAKEFLKAKTGEQKLKESIRKIVTRLIND